MARTPIKDQSYIDVYVRQDGLCALCGTPLKDEAPEMHHMQRVIDDGDNSLDNLALLCSRECHEHMHGSNFRTPIQTTPETYPFFYGKTNQLDFKTDELGETEEVNEPVNEDTDLDSDEAVDGRSIG